MHAILLLFFAGLLPLAMHNTSIKPHALRHIKAPANYPVFNFDSAAAQNMSDSSFLITAYIQNTFEIRAARLARKQSGDCKVKKTALVIKKEHDLISDKLQALITQKGYILPQPSADLEGKFKYLNNLIGKEFNANYANGNVVDTKEYISFYAIFFLNGKDSELKSFASSALPVLQADKDTMEALVKHINAVPKSTW